MNPTSLFSTVLFCLCFQLLSGQTTLINYGENWSYYDAGNEPSPQGSNDWNDTNYDDSNWSTGYAHLGYGDGDEATVLSNNALTGYFRKSLTITNPADYDNLNLDLIYDDGAVVYLNGQEIWRVNMPTGTINYDTFSGAPNGDNASASTNIGNLLTAGTNEIAVEIHQRSAGSSDISFDFKLSATLAGQINVIRGPYLQKASESSMTIKWRTHVPTESVVNYGTSSGNLNLVTSDLALKTEHEIEITGLNPATKYYYELANNSNVLVPASLDMYFQTSPIPGSTPTVKAWILGDCGTANTKQRTVRDAYYNYIGTDHTDMILFLGDNAYTVGNDDEYQTAIFENMYEDKLKNTTAWSCLGNHDGHSANSNSQTGPYYDIFSFPKAGESGGIPSGTEAYYSFDYANIHFISLDSYETDRSVNSAMYNWCQADIQNTTAEWIVAFWHHPPYTKGSHDSDTETALIQMRQNFLPMLEANGIDLVLSGHSHSYERSYLLNGHYGNASTFNMSTNTVGPTGSGDGKSDGNGAYEKTTSGTVADKGAVYITTGSAGKITNGDLNHNAMYYSVAELGSCALEVTGNTMDVKFIRETGVIEDYFTIVKDPTTGCVAGDPCDDNNPCTSNDVYQADCSCAGTLDDSDNDGVCDADDQCPGFDDNLIGTTCDDNDACTINDVYTSSCNCAGVLADADNDGVCDADDQCPNLNDSLIGTPCNDNNDCTVNDVYNSSCDCAGIMADADKDGICDADDQCPGFDDNLIGTPCDDNDACTVNDVYTSSCNCAGILADADNDEVCDADDQCPNLNDNLIGTPCDDNNDCTVNDVYNSSCDCAGVMADADNDGVCDANDQCPGFDDNLIGTACDDNDACTINDVYTSACNCAGVYVDSDNDGICVGQDQDDTNACIPNSSNANCSSCTEYSSDNFEPNWGNWNDGGTDCSRSASNANSGIYSIRIRDNSGAASSLYSDPYDFSANAEIEVQFSFIAIGMEPNEDFFLEISDDGGSSYTIVQEWNVGTEIENNIRYNESVSITNNLSSQTVLRFRCDASVNNDQIYLDDIKILHCNVSCLAGEACDDGNPCTTGDVLNANCDCTGVMADADNDGVCDADDLCPGFDDNLIGTTCDDNDPCTINDVYNSSCGCAGVYVDSDNDGICDTDDQCPTLNDNLIGTACNDNNDCTVNDVYNSFCDCVGIMADTDNDGVCDTDDHCPGFDDNLIGSACDDNDDCTVNDVYNSSCNCAGIFMDADNDGLCAGQDADDNDPCIPDASNTNCSPCNNYSTDNFESNFGNWNDGGTDCARVAEYPNSGNYSIRIRDNSGSASSLYSDPYDFSGVNEIELKFSFIAITLEPNEDFFLEISNDGGSSFSLIEEWRIGYNIENNIRYNESVWIYDNLSSQTVLRFRCDASVNNDRIYLDDIEIIHCNVPCSAGDACSDGDPCTTGDVFDVNCNCAGIYQDSDADGICDNDDLCPGFDDNLIGASCDDGDDCTENDVYTIDCICLGVFTDQDGDGYCLNDDPDDSDACIPDPSSCSPCNAIIEDGFEASYGNWNDGGTDCARTTGYAKTGNYSVRIRDNSEGSSSVTSDELDLSGESTVYLSFSFITTGFSNNEDFFLEISTDGGSSYAIHQEWNMGAEFVNNSRIDEELVINYAFTANTLFRFRCDASSNNDRVYLDDITLSMCPIQNIATDATERVIVYPFSTRRIEEVQIYPNPARDLLFIELPSNKDDFGKIGIYDLKGNLIKNLTFDARKDKSLEVDLGTFDSGMYLLRIESSGGDYKVHRLAIVK